MSNNIKESINLLQPELFPEQPLLTLKRVLLIWLAVLAIMLLFAFFSQTQKKYFE